VYVCMCVCMCMCMYKYIYIHVYVCVCVCMCVHGCVCVCVCVCVCPCMYSYKHRKSYIFVCAPAHATSQEHFVTLYSISTVLRVIDTTLQALLAWLPLLRMVPEIVILRNANLTDARLNLIVQVPTGGKEKKRKEKSPVPLYFACLTCHLCCMGSIIAPLSSHQFCCSLDLSSLFSPCPSGSKTTLSSVRQPGRQALHPVRVLAQSERLLLLPPPRSRSPVAVVAVAVVAVAVAVAVAMTTLA
jgi:hypothetical protein